MMIDDMNYDDIDEPEPAGGMSPSWMKTRMAKITITTRWLHVEELGGMVMLMIEMTSMTNGINPSFKQQMAGNFRMRGF